MNKLNCTVVFFLTSAVSAAAAPQVYPGCAVPAATPNHIWYIDAVHGSASGNGSQAHPWNSLAAAVMDTKTGASPLLSTIPYLHYDPSTKTTHSYPNPSAPIHPGDEILLMSGNYGDIVISTYIQEVSNSDFVTIAAAPGQTPVLSTLYLASTNHWFFSGLKVQSLLSSKNGNPLVYVKDQGASYPTSNIIFQNVTVSSQDDTSGWTQANWLANGRNGLYAWGTAGGSYTTCVSVTGSHMTNVKNGAVVAASNMLFANNQIDHFGSDGIDYAASNLAIKNNYIHDDFTMGDGNHEDAIQGQIGSIGAGVPLNYYKNIVIDSNTIIRQMDPHLQFPVPMQGIDAFDEDWANVTVTNNVIITSACWGISFSSVHNSMIADNTVLDDGLLSEPGGCVPAVAIGNKTSEGTASSNSILRNNVAMSLSIYNLDPGVSMDHNVAVSVGGKGHITDYEGGVVVYYIKPGKYFSSNIIDSGGVASEFLQYSPSTLSYALMLKAGAQIIGAGVANGTPTVDILGDKRTMPYTAGAYAYPF